MPSVRNAINDAVDKKRLPPFQPGSLRDLGVNLRMSHPISLSNMLNTLDNLNPAGFIYDSGPLTAGFVHASAQVYVQSDGLVSFTGQIHESGVTGDNYFCSMALLDVKDESGKTLVFAATGNVAGQLDIGKSDDSWQIDNSSPSVAAHWDIAKNSRIGSVLHVSTDPFQLTETVVGGLFVAAGIVIAAGLAVVFINDPNTECHNFVGPDSNGGVGAGRICTHQFK